MKKFPFSILTLKELYTFGIRIMNVIPENQNDYVQSILNSLNLANTNLEKAMGRALTSEFTSVLIEKDKLRDDVFVGFRNYCFSFVRSQVQAKKQAAALLWNIFETIGTTIYNHSYSVQTAEMNSLIQALKSSEVTTAVTTINGTEWLEQLTEAQNNFEATYSDKVNTESAINYPLSIESKNKIIRYLDALICYIDTASEYNNETYGAIKSQIETIAADVLTQARTRITLETQNREKAKNRADAL